MPGLSLAHLRSLRTGRSRKTFRLEARHIQLCAKQHSDVDAWIQRTTTEFGGKLQFSTEDNMHRLNWLANALPSELTGKLSHQAYPGLHLSFPDRTSEGDLPPFDTLKADGISSSEFYGVPEPFNRRMWASGRITFSSEGCSSLQSAADRRTSQKLKLISKKGFEEGNPMIFVTRDMSWSPISPEEIEISVESITEERTHVFLPPSHERISREVKGLPQPHFSFSYLPTSVTLFRFSAVSRNDHKIHYDSDYCRESEKLKGPAVHGPLTAMLLLQLLAHRRPDNTRIKNFNYRATNPLIVNETCVLHGAFLDHHKLTAKVWATNETGLVGMVADASLTAL